jgi:hypothetical protein
MGIGSPMPACRSAASSDKPRGSPAHARRSFTIDDKETHR